MNYAALKQFIKEAEAKRDMPPFLSQNRPAKVKEIYAAIKRDHPTMPAGKKARIASAMAKRAAATTEDSRSNLSGLAAGTVGRVLGLPAAFLLDPGNAGKFLEGLTPEEARAITDAAAKDFGDDLGGVKVRVGGGDVIDDMRRAITNRNITLPERALGALTAPIVAIQAPLTRADHFNPLSNTIQSYSGNPAILAHELGHAADFNQYRGLSGVPYRLGNTAISLGADLLPGGKVTAGALTQPLTLYHEAKATENALKGEAMRKAMASQYGISPEETPARARNVLLPAYGSYLGGAAGAGLALGSYLRNKKVNPTALSLLPLGGIAAGHVASRAYNALNKPTSLSDKVAEIEYRGRTFPGYNIPIASDRPQKKKMVLAKKGDEVRLVHFGQKGYKHNYSEAAKKNYLARSAGIRGKSGLTKDDKFSANYWARRELWPSGEPADGTAKNKK